MIDFVKICYYSIVCNNQSCKMQIQSYHLHQLWNIVCMMANILLLA